ncbi:MAG: hypothetical protein ACPHAN_14245 [Pseudomonadales bacterium]
MSKAIKILLVLIAIYAGVVTLFESLLGYFQPENQATLVITTFDPVSGEAHDRVISRIEEGGALYVAVNHWPRQWYHRLLENDQVRVKYDGVDGGFTATKVPAAGEQALHDARPLSLGFRILTGFPPRYFVALTPNLPQ